MMWKQKQSFVCNYQMHIIVVLDIIKCFNTTIDLLFDSNWMEFSLFNGKRGRVLECIYFFNDSCISNFSFFLFFSFPTISYKMKHLLGWYFRQRNN